MFTLYRTPRSGHTDDYHYHIWDGDKKLYKLEMSAGQLFRYKNKRERQVFIDALNDGIVEKVMVL